MNKTRPNERTETVPATPAAQSKRYDATFKREAVENWLQTDKPGTQIAAELGISYPASGFSGCSNINWLMGGEIRGRRRRRRGHYALVKLELLSAATINPFSLARAASKSQFLSVQFQMRHYLKVFGCSHFGVSFAQNGVDFLR